jgi:chemotaxis protein MotA
MDLATIIGLIMGGGLLVIATFKNLSQYVDVGSVLIVMGGAMGAVCMSMPLGKIVRVLGIVRHAFFSKKLSPLRVINRLVEFGEIARRDGILALEGAIDDVEDRFLVKGIQMAVDGSDPEVIHSAMTTELEYLQNRHAEGKAIFDGVAKYAPAFGMIGTLIGLIGMLANLSDPDSIAPNMAVALITTLYGAIVANLLAMPIADKLASRSREEVLLKEIIIQGVMAIQSGDNPKIVEQKLKIFLPPALREGT